MASERVSVAWGQFEANMTQAVRDLREVSEFFDVTLACEDKQIQAHKVIISAASPFFRNVLRWNPHPSPLIYLSGIQFSHLQSVLNFIYHGEASIPTEQVNAFLAVATELKVKGLTEELFAAGKTETGRGAEANPGVGAPLSGAFQVEQSMVVKEEPMETPEEWSLPNGGKVGQDFLVINNSFSISQSPVKTNMTEHLKRTYKSLDIRTNPKDKDKIEVKKEPNGGAKPAFGLTVTPVLPKIEPNEGGVGPSSHPGYRSTREIKCRICNKLIPKGFIKQHLVRNHFKTELIKDYESCIRDRMCCYCEKTDMGPAAVIEHIGSYHNKVYDYYKK